MGLSDGRDIFFAGAGILWGVVTIFKGLQGWQQERKRTVFPPMILAGAALALGCTAYLIWSLFAL